MSNPITRIRRCRAAARRYRQLDGEVAAIYRQLYVARCSGEQVPVLDRLAAIRNEQAQAYRAAYGPDLDEDGRDWAESLAAGAGLVHLLADTERVLCHPHTRPDLTAHLQGLPSAEVALWRRLATTPNGAQHADLIYQVADQAAGRLGGPAVDTLFAVADIEWNATHGNQPWTSPRPTATGPTAMTGRTALALAALVTGAAIAVPMIPGVSGRWVLNLYALACVLGLAGAGARALTRAVRRPR